MFKLTQMTIERNGDLTFRVKGSYHCGSTDYIKAGTLNARWRFVVECEPTFDKRGFLFDQAALGAWIEHMAGHEAYESCEHLAADLARKFLDHLHREVPTCMVNAITVSISPNPYLSVISARYERNHDHAA